MLQEVTSQSFDAEVLQENIPVLVDFWAPWCVPCKKIAPIIEELAVKLNSKVKFVKVNVEESSDIATQYMVMSIPTLILFKNRVPCEKKTGLIPREDLEKFVRAHL